MPFNSSLIYLQEWAYIMIIIVCFAVLLTLMAYFICYLISRKNKANMQQLHTNDPENCDIKINEPIGESKKIDYDSINAYTEESQEKSLIAQKQINNNSNNSIFSNFLANFRSVFEHQHHEVPSIDNINNPKNLITIKNSLTSHSISDSGDDSESESHFKSKTLNELERRFKRKNSSKNRNRDSRHSSIPSESRKGSVLTSSSNNSRKNSQDSSSRKTSIESNYYQSSVANLYKKKRLSDASSTRSRHSIDLYNLRKQSINQTSPFTKTNELVGLEYQSNNSDSFIKHIALPLDHSFIQPTVNQSTASHFPTENNHLQKRHLSIVTPNQHEKFWVPADRQNKLEKQRTSLPTDKPLGINGSERKLTIDSGAKFNENSKSLTTSSKMDSAYLSQLSNSDTAEENSGTIPENLVVPSNSRRRASMSEPINLTDISKALYHNYDNSNESPSSQREKVGTIEFSIQYFNDTQKLVLDLLRIFDYKLDENNPSKELYCRCNIMPDKFSFQTKLFQVARDMTVDEQFEFNYVELNHLDACYLEISLYEFDKQTKGEYLGSTMTKLNYSNIESRKILIKDLKVNSAKKLDDDYYGEIMVSLAYLTGAERLTIVVMKAINLKFLSDDKKTLPDPYVKISVFDKDGKRLKKKKTSTEKSTIDPIFNQEIVFFNLKKEQLEDLTIIFSIHNDSIKNRELLGCLEFSKFSKGNKFVQWKNMINGKKSTSWMHHLEMNDQIENEKYMKLLHFVQRSKSPSPYRKESLPSAIYHEISMAAKTRKESRQYSTHEIANAL